MSKLTLTDLEVRSFSTSLSQDIRGGFLVVTEWCGQSDQCSPNLTAGGGCQQQSEIECTLGQNCH